MVNLAVEGSCARTRHHMVGPMSESGPAETQRPRNPSLLGTREHLHITIVTWIGLTGHSHRRQPRLTGLSPTESETLTNATIAREA